MDKLFSRFGKNAVMLVLLGAIVGGVAGAAVAAPIAHANFFSDLWNGITSPFGGGTSTSTSNQSSSPQALYKPAFEYEQAVIDAVKHASPAVVSITISKNLPVLEQCPSDPFSDLPPDFQQFFGGGGGFTQPCDSGKTKLQEVGSGSGFL